MSAAKVSYLLDTSALLTLLENEDGADRVQYVLKQSAVLICAVSLLEVRYLTLRQRDQAEADVRHALLRRIGAEILRELDEPIILRAAAFKAKHSISLADALIAASAYRRGAILLHKDPEFDALADQIKMERLPYKIKGS